MSRFRPIAALALAAILLSPPAANADDDNAPLSGAPTLLALCGKAVDGAPITTELCKSRGYDALVAQLDKAIQAASAKAPANVRPLLRRDQAFFHEMIVMAAEAMPGSDSAEIRNSFDDMLHDRVAALAQIGDGFGRSGIPGKWVDAFGSITVTPAEAGAFRVAIATSSIYGPEDEHQWRCQASAIVRPDAAGWLAGTLLPEPDAVAKHPDASDLKDAEGKPSQPPTIKLRRQGDTLRVVAGVPDDSAYTLTLIPHCGNAEQVTGSFFASGKQDAGAADKVDAAFTAPTFDCTRPGSASEEEICADPELADNDQRLNRAWKALLPRLDDATRRALTDDQRHWVQAQTNQYLLALHPGPDKTTYDMHHLAAGRDGMSRLQRARIALLEGFDENRKGLAGTWLGYTAIIKVTVAENGDLEAKGWKWDQEDWKGGCEYDMSGTAKGGTFRADDDPKDPERNPDTLERDHAMLIVNRRDDAFANKRSGEKGIDAMKCRRSPSASSTARLFPAKPSADIDVFADRFY
ncbi:MAG TPA: lysozyme inhibitor LprI family protein [Bradyrhizobium sp.]|nr:lysozyme inhibitor LprI family protein [Bradyrhizobium sp.]